MKKDLGISCLDGELDAECQALPVPALPGKVGIIGWLPNGRRAEGARTN